MVRRPVRCPPGAGGRNWPEIVWVASGENAVAEASGCGAPQDGAHRRRPPLRAAVGCWCSVGVEVIRDLTKTLARGAQRENVVHELGREDPRPSWFRQPGLCSRWPTSFGDQSLELVDGDEPRSPRHLNRLDKRQDSPVEGRAADPERRGRLCAGVREPLDAGCLANDLDGRRVYGFRGSVSLRAFSLLRLRRRRDT